MDAFRRNPAARNGVAIVVVVLLVIAAVVTALQLYSFSRNVYRNTARASFGTTAEYLAESAAEEGFFILQTECNKPGTDLYRIFREQQAAGRIDYPYSPERLFNRMKSPENLESFKPYPIDRIECSMQIQFAREPFHPLEARERAGEVLLTASVRPAWGRGEETYRRVEVRKPFRTQLITPPTTFDRRALTLFKPDYINGESKQSLDTDIVQPTNKAIDDVNQLNKGYESIIKQGKQMVQWTCCKGACKYVGGSPKFMKASISSGSRIPPDFFKTDSILLGNPDRDPLEKLSDFNYEDILREMYPPLKKIFDTVYMVSNINLQILKVTVPILACIPGKAESAMCFCAAAVCAALHQVLETIVSIQCILGQVSVFILKVILEGVIIGQPTDALRQAARGNFAPALNGISTSLTDVQQSGVLDRVNSGGGKMQGVGQSVQDSNIQQNVQTVGSGNSGSAAGSSAGNAGGSAAGNAGGSSAGSGAGSGQGGASSGGSSSGSGGSSGQPSQAQTQARDNLGMGLDKINASGGAMNFSSMLGMLTGMLGKGEFANSGMSGKDYTQEGALDKLGTDSDTAMLTGLIKGFVKGHRDYYTTEFVNGGDQYSYFMREVSKFYEQYWLERAGFVLKGQAELDAFLERHRESGVNGVVYIGEAASASTSATAGTTPLTIRLDGFHGRAVLYATGGFRVESATLKDAQTDTLTLVTPAKIVLPTSKVQAALAAVPRSEQEQGEGAAVEFSGDADLFGCLFVRRYTVPDNHRSEANSVKGKLEFNKMLPSEDEDGPRQSHVWVTFSPVERGREVYVK